MFKNSGYIGYSRSVNSENASGVPYAYLPFQKVFMSFSNEEMKQYQKGDFLKGVRELTKDEYDNMFKM